MKLSEKIVRLRKSKGMSQETLAEKLNVSRQAISRWEMGSVMPDAANILQISKLFSVTADYLLNDEYESDNDIPQITEIKKDDSKQIIILLITLEVMILLFQFMAAFILQNIIFGFLSFLPFAALIGGFEYACRKKADENNNAVSLFRKRFYAISAWLGLYFPIRFILLIVMAFYPRPYYTLIFECIVLAIYLTASMLVNLSIEKHYLMKGKSA